MWGFWPGLSSFVVAFFSGIAIDTIMKLPPATAKAVTGIGFLISVYCVVSGSFHALNTWEFIDLFGEAQKQDMNVTAKRGFAMFFIMLWPFVMIFAGLLGAYIYGNSFRRLKAAA